VKAVIFGAAGGVGSAVAFNLLLLRGEAFEVVLVDVRFYSRTRERTHEQRAA
jgi:malate/lactate dehydrogenase